MNSKELSSYHFSYVTHQPDSPSFSLPSSAYLKMATDIGKKQVKNASKNASKANEEIIQGFQRLRTEQRQLANKLSELEMDLNEHK